LTLSFGETTLSVTEKTQSGTKLKQRVE